MYIYVCLVAIPNGEWNRRNETCKKFHTFWKTIRKLDIDKPPVQTES